MCPLSEQQKVKMEVEEIREGEQSKTKSIYGGRLREACLQ